MSKKETQAALAEAMLRQRELARARSAEHRKKQIEAGLTQITIWVPKAKSKEFRQHFESIVEKSAASAAKPAIGAKPQA